MATVGLLLDLLDRAKGLASEDHEPERHTFLNGHSCDCVTCVRWRSWWADVELVRAQVGE